MLETPDFAGSNFNNIHMGGIIKFIIFLKFGGGRGANLRKCEKMST